MLTRLSYAQPMVTGSSMGSSAQFPRLRCHAMCNARAKQNGMGVPVANEYPGTTMRLFILNMGREICA